MDLASRSNIEYLCTIGTDFKLKATGYTGGGLAVEITFYDGTNDGATYRSKGNEAQSKTSLVFDRVDFESGVDEDTGESYVDVNDIQLFGLEKEISGEAYTDLLEEAGYLIHDYIYPKQSL